MVLFWIDNFIVLKLCCCIEWVVLFIEYIDCGLFEGGFFFGGLCFVFVFDCIMFDCG